MYLSCFVRYVQLKTALVTYRRLTLLLRTTFFVTRNVHDFPGVAQSLDRIEAIGGLTEKGKSWDLVAHPVTQVIGEQVLVDILDLSKVAWTCWGVSTHCSRLGLRMVKELDLQLALGMNERR